MFRVALRRTGVLVVESVRYHASVLSRSARPGPIPVTACACLLVFTAFVSYPWDRLAGSLSAVTRDPMADHPQRLTLTIACGERLLAILAVLWLQVVGVITHSVLHHMLHAVPLVLLAAFPRGRWVRHTAALTGFVWLLMLALITPMLHHVLTDGVSWTLGAGASTWLAPVMAVLCAVWSSLHVALLCGRPRRWAHVAAGLVIVTLLFALLQPWCAVVFEVPVQHVLAGRLRWLIVLCVEVPVVLVVPWVLLVRGTARPCPPLTPSAVIGQVAYWLVFVLCMVGGLHPALN